MQQTFVSIPPWLGLQQGLFSVGVTGVAGDQGKQGRGGTNTRHTQIFALFIF